MSNGSQSTEIAQLEETAAAYTKQLNQLYLAVGKKYTKLHYQDPEPELQSSIASILGLRKQISDCKKEIAQLEEKMNSGTKCPQCGQINVEGAVFCDSCGQRLLPNKQEDDFVVCKKCGAILPNGSAFCAVCGQRQEKIKEDVKRPIQRCQKCGAPVYGDFCGNCGAPVHM